MIIVGTNIISYFCLSGERLETAHQARQRDPQWGDPWLWRSEFRNILIQYVRHTI